VKIHNVLDTSDKKSAMKGYWISNAYTTKIRDDKKKGLPKLNKVYMGTDYGPKDDKNE
jgi:hypothetical protein